jgi:glutaminyl-tRNA synthetase
MSSEESAQVLDFVRAKVEADLAAGRYGGRVATRFPPEPNGYLHIGSAMAVLLNFSIAERYGGVFHLRFDDTNPSREEHEYVESIQEDVRWLGCDWGEHLYFASDYFEQLYEYSLQLIRTGKAYVCELDAKEIREYRGTLTEAGRPSPWRDRPVEENLELFERMRSGEFDDGSKTLRARIDMASSNLNLRDPVLYRIQRSTHHRTGDDWVIYPTYDWAHGQSDAIERITHSICTLEFEDHRPLYDWFLEQLGIHHPLQIEFARLNVSHTVTSKRKLRQLVEERHVAGWDDPRMPTVRGLRRRGFTPASIRSFCGRIGVSKRDSINEFALLEHCAREDLNRHAPRVMGVLRPLRLVIENYPDDGLEQFDAINNPEDLGAGTRKVPFSKVLYIEREDFLEEAPRKFFRLTPGREVRLRYAYLVTCTGFEKDDASGEVTEVRCVYDPATRGGDAPDKRRVKGTLHWVSAEHALDVEVRLYDHLFSVEDPERGEGDWLARLNPSSLETLTACKVEPSLSGAEPGARFQFERQGYFCVDSRDSSPERLVFNRTVSLRDSWARVKRQQS